MNFLQEALSYSVTAANWSGPAGLGIRIAEHLQYTFIAVIFSRDRSTRIWRRTPPSIVTAATPAVRSRRGDRSFCATSRNVTWS